MLFPILTTAQNNPYYYYKGQKVFLTLDKSSINIITDISFQKSSVSNINLKDFELKTDNTATSIQKFALVDFIAVPSDLEYFQKMNSVKSNQLVTAVNPSYKTVAGDKLGMSNYLYVKLKNASDLSLLQTHATNKNLVIVSQNQFMPLWYTLKCTKNTIENTLQIANYLFETGSFAASSPDFLFDNSEDLVATTSTIESQNTSNICVNDPNFPQQWGLFNGYTDGINPNTSFNYDINACEAWAISEGLGVKVAVVDGGIDLTNTELMENLSLTSYDSDTQTSPSQIYGAELSYHGTFVAGIIGAVKNNDSQIAGVAPKSQLLSISNSLNLTLPNASSSLANAINWAWQIGGADIINNSWKTPIVSQLVEDAIELAITDGRNGKGTIIIFASGNNPLLRPGGYNVKYPANPNEKIITCGAMTSSGSRTNISCYGESLDMVAPGSLIISTVLNNNLSVKTGTSFAGPHVSGIAALLLSVNSCLSAKQVRDVIEKTCQKVGGYSYATTAGRPNGTWNEEMGYGLVDAHAAVLMAQAMNSTTLDLMVKDTPTDFGIQPNTTSTVLWNSPDIWVRNQQDTVQAHQNPQFNPTVPNYIYTKITNKSCAASTGTEKLKIYCSIPNYGTSSSSFRSAIAPVNSAVTLIGTLDIPVLSPGQETIVSLPWNVPFFVSCNETEWNTFLLTKIISLTDINAFAEVSNTYTNIKNNNNIAGKSIVVINAQAEADGILSGSVGIDNTTNTIKNVKFEIIKEATETGKAIYEEAEISIKMDETFYTAWDRGGKLSNNISTTPIEKVALVTNNLVQLNNTVLHQNESGSLELQFNFLTQELTDKTEYQYHLIQKNASTNDIEGGCTFEIHKNIRPIFVADAGTDKAVDKNESIAISASQISEPAIYNWYDSLGNLIYTGKDLTVTTDIATKYKLEVIATADGFKDYSEVDISIKPSTIGTISPNPASSNITVDYKINEAGTVYLMILGNYGTAYASNNYILDSNLKETLINIANYPNGFYTVALVCNGQIVDAKTIIKN